jgi:hypothetical protein
MSNMSYCRFQNTKTDLRDCVRNFWSVSSEDEADARKRLVKYAKEIVELYDQNPEDVDNCVYDEDAEDEDEG